MLPVDDNERDERFSEQDREGAGIGPDQTEEAQYSCVRCCVDMGIASWTRRGGDAGTNEWAKRFAACEQTAHAKIRVEGGKTRGADGEPR